VLPSFDANFRFGVTSQLNVAIGYSFLFLGDVVRPGDVVDPVVNGLLLDGSLPFAGPSRPDFSWDDSDLWIMGINLGVEYSF
jgi:hypothetical protein